MQSDREPLALNDDAARAKVGSTLGGKWHLDELIGVGGMSAVYAATHRNGMRGAVKILDPSLSPSVALAARKRFLREGRLANRVHHLGAVQVLDDDEAEDGSTYLVMELLSGSTLEELATRSGGTLEAAKAIEYGLQVVDTLAEAHASGIVHRDIKPENLFLTNEGLVKILDFGIAGMAAQEVSATLTRTGDLIGTPAFMAPEQARGRVELVDHQSDLYSLGATLFTLLTGKLLNEAETVAEMLVLTMTRNSPSLADAMPDAPDALVRAIDGALELEKSKRWANAAAMRAALEEAYVALTGKPQRVRNRRRKLTMRWLASLAIVVGVVGVTLASLIAPRGFAVAATEHAARTPMHAESGAPMRATVSPVSSPATARRYDPIYDRRR